MDDELEKIREKKKKELQEEREEDMKRERDSELREIITEDARSRLKNIETVDPEKAEEIRNQIFTLYKSNRVNGRIDDKQMKQLLKELNDDGTEINIKSRNL